MAGIHTGNFLKHEQDINPAFEIANKVSDRKSAAAGLAIALLIHAALGVIFLFVLLKPPFPPLSIQGVFLNIGYEDEGMGTVQPMGTADELTIPKPESSPAGTTSNQVLTSDMDESAPVIPSKKDEKKTVTATTNSANQTTKPVSEVKTETPKALYPGNQSNNSTSEGTGNSPGDQGKPDGSPYGTEYDGIPGPGNGGSPILGMSGRKIIFFPPITDSSQKTGKVVVNIQVDKKGNIISAKATQKGSTTTDAYLFSLAEEAALKTKVNADANAAEVQFGTITYTFKLR